MYRDCRKAAGISLLNASLDLEICRERLIKIEYNEEEAHPGLVLKMCEEYQSGLRLASWHCANQCSIGHYRKLSYSEMIPTHAGMQLLGAIDDITLSKASLIEILKDGNITANEFKRLEDILETCRTLNKAAMALEIEKEKSAHIIRLTKEKPPVQQHRRQVVVY